MADCQCVLQQGRQLAQSPKSTPKKKVLGGPLVFSQRQGRGSAGLPLLLDEGRNPLNDLLDLLVAKFRKRHRESSGSG